MTTLSDIYGAYNTLKATVRKLSSHTNFEKDAFWHENSEANESLNMALCEIETAIAFVPAEEPNDNKIKQKQLRHRINELYDKEEKIIDFVNLTDKGKEEIAMLLLALKDNPPYQKIKNKQLEEIAEKYDWIIEGNSFTRAIQGSAEIFILDNSLFFSKAGAITEIKGNLSPQEIKTLMKTLGKKN